MYAVKYWVGDSQEAEQNNARHTGPFASSDVAAKWREDLRAEGYRAEVVHAEVVHSDFPRSQQSETKRKRLSIHGNRV